MPCLHLLLAVPMAAAGFELGLEADIVQRRDVVEPGHQVVELARILPPREEAWTLSVQVPDAWVERPRGAGHSPTALERAAGPQLGVMVSAVRRDMPSSSGLTPLEAAGLWAGLLRNSAYATPHPVSHYAGLLEPWELLYDASAGDTLSAAVVTAMALERQGVQASVARYPSPSTASGVAFGLLLEGSAPAGADWAWPVSGTTPAWALLPLHLKAKPGGTLGAADLQAWTLTELQAPGWDPGAPASPSLAEADEDPEGAADPRPRRDPEEPEPGATPEPAPAPPPPRRQPRPDICAQAEAMGLACRPVDRSNDPLWLGLAVLASAGLVGAGAASWLARGRRRAAALARKRRREVEEF
jgi:hypothetical protein